MANSINNMTTLVNDLAVVYSKLRMKQIQVKDAKEIANVSGKIIKGISTQLEYNQWMKKTKTISFLEY